MTRAMPHPRPAPLARPAAAAVAAALTALSVLLAPAGCASNRSPQDDLARNQAEAEQLARDAQRAEKAGNKDRAIALYQDALKLDDSFAAAWHNLGVLLMEKKELQPAATAFRKAADLSPTDPRPYEALAILYRDAGWRDDSIKYFELALERDPDSIKALRGLALAAKEEARADEITRDRLRHAILIEKDEKWRMEFKSLLLRVEAELAASKKARPGELPFTSPASPGRR